MSTGFIDTAVTEGVFAITLNRPEKLNAWTWAIVDDLLDQVARAEADPAVHAILIRGAGRCFSAGNDIAQVVDHDPVSHGVAAQDDIRGMQRAANNWRRLWECTKPVIVAVHGYCLGAALEVVVHADITIASEDATFGYPAVRGSGLPDTHMFTYAIGPQWTRFLLLTGDSIDAATAREIGLVLKVVPREALETEAFSLAARMKQVPLPIARAAKQVVNQGIELMGYSPLQRVNWNEGAMARVTPEVAEFTRVAQQKGARGAIQWRDRADQAAS